MRDYKDIWIYPPSFKKRIGAYYLLGIFILIISFAIDCWLSLEGVSLDLFPRVGSLVTLFGLILGVLGVFFLHSVERQANWHILVATELGSLKIRRKKKHLPDEEIDELVKKNIERAEDEALEMAQKASGGYKLIELVPLVVETIIWGWGDLMVDIFTSVFLS